MADKLSVTAGKGRDPIGTHVRIRKVIFFAVLIGGAACFLFFLYRTGIWFKIPDALRRAGVFGVAISFLMIVFQTVVPFAPFALLAGFNVTVHGFILGYLITFAGAFTGAVLLYWVAIKAWDTFLQKPLHRFLHRHPKMDKALRQVSRERSASVFFVILTLRLQPWLPSSAIDIMAGAAHVRFWPFVAATIGGQAPMIALESYVGHRILHFRTHQREIWIIGIVSVLLLIIYWAIRYRRARAKMNE
ncbi:TVP38/TMEM64 family protein [Sulfoacidibacillus thermotolerans]|uniref:TVP38/TMEM64 family protein n=1 Tax=Sulfoacidibacillus thermotolerans TaxID=1765684 RepID=UPI0015E7E62B|nr:VTT domain-containing protein [Sulfoacidibacillus thermotolerans]